MIYRFLFSLVLVVSGVHAENNAEDGADGGDYDGASEFEYSGYADESSSSSSGSGFSWSGWHYNSNSGSTTFASGVDQYGNYYNKFSVCSNSLITVEDISILCDSPGTYYYGSGKYRNSAECKAGDKAKVTVAFTISQSLQYQPYLTLSVSGYGTVPGNTLYQDEQLCGIGALSTSSNKIACPQQGNYTISRTFHFQDQSDSYDYSFVPKVTVGFTSNPQKNVYDLGGANTQKCSGDTFYDWTQGVRKSAANTIRTFFATFGILLGSVVFVFIAGWVIMSQNNNRPKDMLVEDPLDESQNHKVLLVGDSRNNLVDF